MCTVIVSVAAGSPAKSAPPPCCAVTEPAVAACCVEEKNVAQLSAKSLYLLDAKWTNDDSATVRLASLRGKPVVLAMIFTHCEYACPVLVQDIQRMRAALPEAVRAKAQIVLVSFDTERDTPAALKAFRERATLDANWTLLRGDAADVQELAMLLGVKFKRDARGQFAHSNLFTILNAAGEIVHRHLGLNGDISEAARALAVVAK
jgi:protein SCO1/2